MNSERKIETSITSQKQMSGAPAAGSKLNDQAQHQGKAACGAAAHQQGAATAGSGKPQAAGSKPAAQPKKN
jgi:hypothetical protein